MNSTKRLNARARAALRDHTREHATPASTGGEGEEGAGVTHYSGVLVLTRPARLETCAGRVDAIPGVEVHLRDRVRGRLIAVLESRDAQGQESLLRLIRAEPEVLSAALVYHHVDDEGAAAIAAGGCS